jgi:hypothetical protein
VLTEVAAYPAFVWAVLAMQASTAAPSRRNDLLALLAIGLAFAGRTQFAILLILLPLAIVAHELGRTGGVRRSLRAAVESHRLLAAVYGVLAATGLVLAAVGRLPGVLGVYGATIGGTGASVGERIVPGGIGGSLVEHTATFALANLVRPGESGEAHAFACIGAITVVALVLEVTIFDLRFGERFVHDRYLFYLVPLVVLGFLCAIADLRPPRWSLVPPAGLVALGFAVGELPRFTWEQFTTVNSDAPISALYRPIARTAGSLASARIALVIATVGLTALFALGVVLRRRRIVARVSVAFLLVVVPSLTAYMFVRVLDEPSWSGRPLTQTPAPSYDWVDRTVGENATVAMAPYPVSSAYFVNQRVWRDYEFWNKSITRDIQQPDKTFLFTGETFGKLYPRFDAVTGASDLSPAPYVLQANQETRFRIAGTVQVLQPDVMLIVARRPWRLDWRTSGLYPDGWTRPRTTGRVRVYAVPGQDGAVTRSLSLGFRAPEDVPERPVAIATNLERWEGTATASTTRAPIRVCVPAGGFAEVRIRARGASPIPGDLRDIGLGAAKRQGGVLVTEVALADEVGKACRPRQ